MLVIIVVVIILIITAIFTIFLLQARKQPPAYGLIIQKYYACHEHKNLEGGIFGKGPLKRLNGKGKRPWCWRSEWKEIDRATFMRLATKWYGIDWSNEIEFWKNK